MLANYNTYRKKGQFNYSMVASGGVAIYIFVVILAMLYKMHFNAISSFPLFLFVLRETGFYLLLMLAPVMMVMALFLLVSNLWLIKKRGTASSQYAWHFLCNRMVYVQHLYL